MVGEISPILLLLALSLGVKITYYIARLYTGIKRNDNPENTPLHPISVIISARNEEQNLINLLPKVLDQDYPEYEVVVVNDRSVDDTPDVLRALEEKYQRLRVTTIAPSDQHWAGKKYALTIGLKAAKYDHVLLTDADCYPASDQWIKEMAKNFREGKNIVLGYGAYIKLPGLLNHLIRAETASIAFQYSTFSRMQVPYMGVGRNIAYHKDLFFMNKGFANHMELMSGDDDLFVNEVAKPKNSTVCFDYNAITYSIPENNFGDWLEQKRRHLTTSIRYNSRSKLLLSILSGGDAVFYFTSILTFFLFPAWHYSWSAIPIAWMFCWGTSYAFYNRIRSLDLLISAPVLELFQLIFYPIAYLQNLIISGNPWKNY